MAQKSKKSSRGQRSLPSIPPPEIKPVKDSSEQITELKAPIPKSQTRTGGDLLIVDNSNPKWRVVEYLKQWCEIAKSIDIATGYFEIGSLLALDTYWQNLDEIRILMGDEISKRTQKTFLEAVEIIKNKLDNSIESEKEENDFLDGVPSIVNALVKEQIKCRMYREKKFHAKAYITHAKFDVVGSIALVGSSNFTFPGLHENIELNVQVRSDVEELQEWYETFWNEAEDISPEIIKVISRQIKEYSPFEVYAKSLYEFFKGHELTASEWEKTESVIYPILDQYQKEGYHALMKIATQYRGALLCDSVGLGKTFIGLMVIERLLFDRKRVALIVPKSARVPVWEKKLSKHLPGYTGAYSNLAIYNHSDLLRSGRYVELMEEVAQKADAIIIDEAHHFRNQSTNQYKKLYSMLEGKQLFLLTATPINNSLLDLQHLIELFSRRRPDYFSSAPLGIHSLQGHFRNMERALKRLVGEESADDVEITTVEAEQILEKDDLFKSLVVQRSRSYARESQKQNGGTNVIFPVRNPPHVVKFSLVKTYGRLLGKVETAFKKDHPLLTLAIYNPTGYPKGSTEDFDPLEIGRQAQVVGLIRTLLLKRFESSAKSFEDSCEELFLKLLSFVACNSITEDEKKRFDHWKENNESILNRIKEHQRTKFEDREEDDTPLEFLVETDVVERDKFRVEEIIEESYKDLSQLKEFLEELNKLTPEQDDKLQTLIHLLKMDPLLKDNKVIIFTEYMSTARYLYAELKKAGIESLAEVDSSSSGNRSDVISSFSPYYNDMTSEELRQKKMKEIRVLISTDVLSEGLNLQDATLLMNYDLHWNPVRLMQRIGRVDRRLDPTVEKKIIQDHPDWKEQRGKINFWNFLPPGELDRLLTLYERVAHKTLRISKTFGIEGKQLLRPEDDYQALRDFNSVYEGSTSAIEAMRLEYRALINENPELEEMLEGFPKRLYSGRPKLRGNFKGVFFCYALPAKNLDTGEWDTEANFAKWYFYDLETEKILENAEEINQIIRSTPKTPRVLKLEKAQLVEIRKKINRYIINTYLKSVQAPIGVKPTLMTWMEIH